MASNASGDIRERVVRRVAILALGCVFLAVAFPGCAWVRGLFESPADPTPARSTTGQPPAASPSAQGVPPGASAPIRGVPAPAGVPVRTLQDLPGALEEELVAVPSKGPGLIGIVFRLASPTATAVSNAPVPASVKRPAIVLLHGCGGMVDGRGRLAPRHRDWAERFARWGFVALTLDSFGPRGFRSICELKDRPVQPWRDRSIDTQAALVYLAARNDVDPKAIFMLGWSHGGSTVLGAVRPQVAGPPARVPRYKAAIAFYPGCEQALAQRSYQSSLPLLILHGEADDWTPVAPCMTLTRRLAEAGHPVSLVTYPGAHHGFDVPSGQVTLLPNVYRPGSPGDRGAHAGMDPRARSASIDEVRRFMQIHLAP